MRNEEVESKIRKDSNQKKISGWIKIKKKEAVSKDSELKLVEKKLRQSTLLGWRIQPVEVKQNNPSSVIVGAGSPENKKTKVDQVRTKQGVLQVKLRSMEEGACEVEIGGGLVESIEKVKYSKSNP